jgi:site-specific recombinase XerD
MVSLSHDPVGPGTTLGNFQSAILGISILALTPVSLADAWESFLADLTARRVSSSTIGKYKLLQRQLEAYSQSRGLACVVNFDLETLSRFRATWKDGPRTAAKKLERLRAFFRFAAERRWCETNPAALLRPPKVSLRPTMPVEHGDLVKILTACEKREVVGLELLLARAHPRVVILLSDANALMAE